MNRIMGLDVGDKTIGVAVSDPLGITAQGVTTIRRIGIKKDLEELEGLIDEYSVNKIVVGLPKNMNNTIGPQGEKVLKFVKKIENKFKMDIILQDERLTTVSAERMLIEGDVSRKKRKEIIDKVAATYILQAYLDKNQKKEGEQ
ncbi:Holliday junction resolvase RuvX [Anaerosalibacter sp. Marseille-P3206]|uniref:Holliday junction resolvase RuvX n=1 Tax=Anaerosalibacter sp. Marseille-P3206 TaxID=1871005 RepID=UPI000987D221|nr:Holliday junction resolvase RuvX [Anaerosalibacter sp. Marseille-P3206]